MSDPRHRSHGNGSFRPEDFRALGPDCVFETGALVFHPENISLGRNVYVGHYAILKGYYRNELRIGDETWIGQQVFMHAAGGLTIGARVGIGPAVKILTSHAPRGRARDAGPVFAHRHRAGIDRGRRRHRYRRHPAARGDHRSRSGGGRGRGGDPRRPRLRGGGRQPGPHPAAPLSAMSDPAAAVAGGLRLQRGEQRAHGAAGDPALAGRPGGPLRADVRRRRQHRPAPARRRGRCWRTARLPGADPPAQPGHRRGPQDRGDGGQPALGDVPSLRWPDRAPVARRSGCRRPPPRSPRWSSRSTSTATTAGTGSCIRPGSGP